LVNKSIKDEIKIVTPNKSKNRLKALCHSNINCYNN
jgi:hypothetical protein